MERPVYKFDSLTKSIFDRLKMMILGKFGVQVTAVFGQPTPLSRFDLTMPIYNSLGETLAHIIIFEGQLLPSKNQQEITSLLNALIVDRVEFNTQTDHLNDLITSEKIIQVADNQTSHTCPLIILNNSIEKTVYETIDSLVEKTKYIASLNWASIAPNISKIEDILHLGSIVIEISKKEFCQLEAHHPLADYIKSKFGAKGLPIVVMKNDYPSEINYGHTFDLQITPPTEIVDNYLRLMEPTIEDSRIAEDPNIKTHLQNPLEKVAFLDTDWHH